MILSPKGTIKTSLSFAKMIAQIPLLLDAVRNDDLKESIYDPNVWDVMHTNTVELIDREVVFNGQKPFEEGQVLFCMRQLDLVGVVDVDQGNDRVVLGPG